MEIFIRNVEVRQSMTTPNLSQIKMSTTTQLVELCMTHRNAQYSEVLYHRTIQTSEVNTMFFKYEDSNDGFNKTGDDDILAKLQYAYSPISPNYSPDNKTISVQEVATNVTTSEFCALTFLASGRPRHASIHLSSERPVAAHLVALVRLGRRLRGRLRHSDLWRKRREVDNSRMVTTPHQPDDDYRLPSQPELQQPPVTPIVIDLVHVIRLYLIRHTPKAKPFKCPRCPYEARSRGITFNKHSSALVASNHIGTSESEWLRRFRRMSSGYCRDSVSGAAAAAAPTAAKMVASAEHAVSHTSGTQDSVAEAGDTAVGAVGW
ncbi:hypothetical protein QTP88_023656 [Uroleucon formosanum]